MTRRHKDDWWRDPMFYAEAIISGVVMAIMFWILP